MSVKMMKGKQVILCYFEMYWIFIVKDVVIECGMIINCIMKNVIDLEWVWKIVWVSKVW